MNTKKIYAGLPKQGSNTSQAIPQGITSCSKKPHGRSTFLTLTLGLFLFSSCEKYLEVGLPKTQLTAKTVFESDATATAALATTYLRAGDFAGGGANSITLISAYLADETDSYTTSQPLQQLANGQPIPSNSVLSTLWNNLYTVIYQSNVLIEGISNNPKISPASYKRLHGEALFLRAYAHLSLSSLFGDVPLALSSDYRSNALLARSPSSAVYSQVISDLQQAKELLGDTYASYNNERIGANRWTASALLARAYLYSGDYTRAQSEASLVIGSPLFSLPPLAQVFLKNSNETILSYRPAANLVATPEANIFILTARPQQLALSASFHSGFENGDARKTNWTAKLTTGGIDYFYPFKYKSRNSSPLTEYSVILRLAEQHLIRAEASARLNQLPAALADLDLLRQRAGLPKLSDSQPALGQTAVIDAVFKERRSELFTEWNHRWVDLQRFGKATSLLPLVKPDWKPHVLLLPIPEADMRSNPNLVQNPGYQ